MQVKAYGDRGLSLAHLTDVERSDWIRRLEAKLPEHCSEYVVGYDSILLIGCPKRLSPWLDRSLEELASFETESTSPAQRRPVIRIPVTYNGSDLDFVSEQTGLSVEEIVRVHSEPTYTVRMMGFSPGFPYLDGLDERLHLERRANPRTRIEPGAVAIGGPHAGIYTIASPGGWHLLGHTTHPLYNLEAARGSDALDVNAREIFSLAPDDRVQFYPVQEGETEK